MIKYSRHAKRRMQLYGIGETDVESVLDLADVEILEGNRSSVVLKIKEKFKYPIKVLVKEEGSSKLVVTVYPLKRRKTK